jgi:hypothetical protein
MILSGPIGPIPLESVRRQQRKRSHLPEWQSYPGPGRVKSARTKPPTPQADPESVQTNPPASSRDAKNA